MDKLLLPFETAIAWLIAEIYEYVPNVGIAIILVTLMVMLLIFPLTHKQTKSTLGMQALQPKMKELQVKYKDDRQKLSEETMALYKENGVNPLGGCLPTLVQMPFLFSIFRVVREPAKFADTGSRLFKDLCSPVKTADLCRANAAELTKAGYSPGKAEELASKLPISKTFLGLDLQTSLKNYTNPTTWVIIAYVVLIILLAATSYISMSRQQKINPNTPSQMKFLKYIFPIGISVSGVILPAGPNLYILTSSTWRAFQQELLYRKLTIPHREREANKDKDKDGWDSDKGKDPNYQAGLARQKRKKK